MNKIEFPRPWTFGFVVAVVVGLFIADTAAAVDPPVPCDGCAASVSGCDEPGSQVPPPVDSDKLASQAYGQSFTDNNFSYLRDDDSLRRYFGDSLKQLELGAMWIDIGGEHRMRAHDEHNLRGKPIAGIDDRFVLSRLRLFANLQISEDVRIFAEAIDADSFGENIQPRATEVNRFDAQNLLLDVRLLSDDDGNEWWVRGGRQEVILGSTRLVFRRAWRNTPQNFDGLRTWVVRGQNRVDGYWLRPIDVRQHAGGDRNFDESNSSQNFFGAFATHSGDANEKSDLYYLGYTESDPTVKNFDGTVGDFSIHTLGARWLTPLGDPSLGWRFEAEGGYQFGSYAADRHSAAFTVIGLGRKFSEQYMKPEIWVYHDWASGDGDLNDGVHQTFLPPFPRGHYFLGFADITGRQNIHDVNAQLALKPTKKTRLRLAYHRFWLAAATDALYSPGGSSTYHAPNGSAGRDVGQELDIAFNWNPTPRTGFLLGYSYFWTGDFFAAPAIRGGPAGLASNGANGEDASFVYGACTVRF